MTRFLLFLLMYSSILAFGQQDPQFTLDQDRNTFTNPALMVDDYDLKLQAVFRAQWVGFDGAPVTGVFQGSYFVERAWSAFGVSAVYGQLGAETFSYTTFNYAFVGQIGDHRLIPAVSIGMISRTIDGSQITAIEPGDPNIPTGKSTGIGLDLGVGLSYMFEGLLVGVSSTHLNEAEFLLDFGGLSRSYNIARHIYGVASYDAHIGNHFRLKPIALGKTDFASTQFEQFLWIGARNLTAVFDGVDIGVGYRIDDAVMFGIDLNFKWFSLAYSYDYTISGLSSSIPREVTN